MPYTIQHPLLSSHELGTHMIHVRFPTHIGNDESSSDRHWVELTDGFEGLILGKSVRDSMGLIEGQQVTINVRTARLVKVNNNPLPGGFEYGLGTQVVAAESVAEIMENAANIDSFIGLGGDTFDEHFEDVELSLDGSALSKDCQIKIAKDRNKCRPDAGDEQGNDDLLGPDHFEEVIREALSS